MGMQYKDTKDGVKEKWIVIPNNVICYCSDRCSCVKHQLSEPNTQSKYTEYAPIIPKNVEFCANCSRHKQTEKEEDFLDSCEDMHDFHTYGGGDSDDGHWSM